jgi:hypothetical protein
VLGPNANHQGFAVPNDAPAAPTPHPNFVAIKNRPDRLFSSTYELFLISPCSDYFESKSNPRSPKKRNSYPQLLFRLENNPTVCFQQLTSNSNRTHVSVRRDRKANQNRKEAIDTNDDPPAAAGRKPRAESGRKRAPARERTRVTIPVTPILTGRAAVPYARRLFEARRTRAAANPTSG